MKFCAPLAAFAAGAFSLQASATPLPSATPSEAGFAPEGPARLDRFFAREIAAKRVPGGVIAIARDGQLVHYKAHGFLDSARGTRCRSMPCLPWPP